MEKPYWERLTDLRKLHDKSQAYIATNVLNMEPSTYGKKEQGISKYTIEELLTLCDYYAVDVRTVLYGETAKGNIQETAAEYRTRTTPMIDVSIKMSLANAERMGIKDLILEQMGAK